MSLSSVIIHLSSFVFVFVYKKKKRWDVLLELTFTDIPFDTPYLSFMGLLDPDF